ncbi:cytochrome-c peroxidase [Cognatishimia sp. F0-27]|uniref:cytochrome-c peroxidase n=1 Tax=Cognatishimia sp. F0-27 TaxID=2816855 RepID=UPI00351D8961
MVGRGRPTPRRAFTSLAHAALLSLGLATSTAAEAIDPDDFLQFDPAQARLGQMLFYDKILSGNRNISCGTCHHHELGSTDRLSLGIGEGGIGIGPERVAMDGKHRVRARIPRNAPALWNLAHRDVAVLFHDGRLEVSDLYGNGFDSPAEEYLPTGLNSIIAAQALFPMTSDAEMAGEPGSNEVAGAFKDRIDKGWPLIAKRVRTIPAYGEMFVDCFDHIDKPEQVTIVEIANAIAAFIGTEFRSFDSPYDAYMTQGIPLPGPAERGRQLFFGKARCATCHNGPLFSDQQFHAAGIPQFGPGRTRPFDPIPRDVGRMGATDRLTDAYRFRTPSLRNVALTAPYGHNGAYPDLRSMIRHMADPKTARAEWKREMARLPDIAWVSEVDFAILEDRIELARQDRNVDITPVSLSEDDIGDIEAFLLSLTGASVDRLPLGRPDAVPSGLPVD